MHSQPVKANKGKWLCTNIYCTNSRHAKLDSWSSSLLQTNAFLVRVLVAFLPLSKLCLLHAVSATPSKIFADWKTIDFWKKASYMWRTRNICKLFCFRMVFSFPHKEKRHYLPLDQHAYFYFIKVSTYSILSTLILENI